MAAGVAVQMLLHSSFRPEMQQETRLLLICRHRVSPSQIIGEEISGGKKNKTTGRSEPARALVRGLP